MCDDDDHDDDEYNVILSTHTHNYLERQRALFYWHVFITNKQNMINILILYFAY